MFFYNLKQQIDYFTLLLLYIEEFNIKKIIRGYNIMRIMKIIYIDEGILP